MLSRLSFATLLLFCTPCVAKTRPVSSWGKQGVTFEHYRQDAVECAKRGYFRDVSRDEPAKRFLRGFRTADDALNEADMGGPDIDRWRDSILRTQPDRRKRELHAIQVTDVEQCLLDRGYRKFTLTREEAEHLSRYPAGSIERHRFLHTLAAR